MTTPKVDDHARKTDGDGTVFRVASVGATTVVLERVVMSVIRGGEPLFIRQRRLTSTVTVLDQPHLPRTDRHPRLCEQCGCGRPLDPTIVIGETL